MLSKSEDSDLSDPEDSDGSSGSESSDWFDEVKSGLNTWQKTLGHLSSSRFKHLSRLGLLKLKLKDLNKPVNCVKCAEGK